MKADNSPVWISQCDKNHIYKDKDTHETETFMVIDFNDVDDFILASNSKMRSGYVIDIDRLKVLINMHIERRIKNLCHSVKIVVKLPIDTTHVMAAIITAATTKLLPHNDIFGSTRLTKQQGEAILYRIQ